LDTDYDGTMTNTNHDYNGGTGNDVNGYEFDSLYEPEASAFFELYNPWVQDANTQLFPAELYGGGGVNLQQQASDGSPVWRMIVSQGDNPQWWDNNPPPSDRILDPDDPAFADLIARKIYSVPPPNTHPAEYAGQRVYFPWDIPVQPVRRGDMPLLDRADLKMEAVTRPCSDC
jgi:hypothetical protein